MKLRTSKNQKKKRKLNRLTSKNHQNQQLNQQKKLNRLITKEKVVLPPTIRRNQKVRRAQGVSGTVEGIARRKLWNTTKRNCPRELLLKSLKKNLRMQERRNLVIKIIRKGIVECQVQNPAHHLRLIQNMSRLKRVHQED
jgi:hypothetical protein